MRELRDRFERAIRAGWPAAVVIGADAPRLPHTSNIAFVGLDRQALFIALDQAGVACSTGSACASGSSEPSPALVAMGCERGRVFERFAVQLGGHDDRRRGRRSGSPYPRSLQRLAATKRGLKFARDGSRSDADSGRISGLCDECFRAAIWHRSRSAGQFEAARIRRPGPASSRCFPAPLGPHILRTEPTWSTT